MNIDALLEAVLLTADAALDLRANPDKDARGVAIEANLDRGRGPWRPCWSSPARCTSATHRGRLGPRPRPAMLDEHGNALTRRPRRVRSRSWACPRCPRAGDTFLVAPTTARPARSPRSVRPRDRQASLAKAPQAHLLEDLTEALAAARSRPSTSSSRVTCPVPSRPSRTRCCRSTWATRSTCGSSHRGVGAITRTTSSSRWPRQRDHHRLQRARRGPDRRLAEREGVEIRYYSVIYQAIDEIEAALKGMLKPEFEEIAARHRRGPRGLPFLQVRQHRRFHRALRRDHARHEGTHHSATASWSPTTSTIAGLRRFKDDATEVREGFECGINLGSLQRPAGRRPHRDVRDAREAARLIRSRRSRRVLPSRLRRVAGRTDLVHLPTQPLPTLRTRRDSHG